MATVPTNIQKLFGTISPPQGIEKYEKPGADQITVITTLLSNILKITIFAAGLFALVNFIISGIQLIGSTGNPEYIKQANSRIWMSILGITIIAGSLIISAIIGWIFFKDPAAIISPIIPKML